MAVDTNWHRSPVPHRRLRRGHRGADVQAFQTGLNARLRHVPEHLRRSTRRAITVDGVFGTQTLAAWREVRFAIGLPVGHPPTMAAQMNVRRPATRSLAARRRARQRRRRPGFVPRIVTANELGLSFAYVFGRKGRVYRFAGHYSGGPKSTSVDDTIQKARSFHNHHQARGWGGCSYEYVVGPGVVVCLNPTDRKSAAVAGQNTGMAGVCVPGTLGDRIDPLTRQTLAWLFDNAHTSALPARHRMPRPIRTLDCRGHKEFPGQATSCPGDYLPTYKELFRG